MIHTTTVYPDRIPAELRERRQWVAWRPVQREGQPKPTKVPIDPNTRRLAKTTDSSTWSTFDQALDFARRHRIGLGFVFSEADPYSGVDLDGCRDPQTGSIAAWARAIVDRLDSYTEASPSGTGVHVIIRARLADRGRRRGPFEVYSAARYFCTTGDRLDGCPPDVRDRQRELDALIARLFPPAETSTPRSTSGAGTLADDELLARAMRARNGGRFRRLWAGEWQALGYGSQSEADAALAAMLAYWTDNDPARVDALFRLSGLCQPKWTERSDYRERTLAKVLH